MQKKKFRGGIKNEKISFLIDSRTSLPHTSRRPGRVPGPVRYVQLHGPSAVTPAIEPGRRGGWRCGLPFAAASLLLIPAQAGIK